MQLGSFSTALSRALPAERVSLAPLLSFFSFISCDVLCKPGQIPLYYWYKMSSSQHTLLWKRPAFPSWWCTSFSLGLAHQNGHLHGRPTLLIFGPCTMQGWGGSIGRVTLFSIRDFHIDWSISVFLPQSISQPWIVVQFQLPLQESKITGAQNSQKH